MALIKCRECGKEISDKATACPSCGAPLLPAADAAGVVTTQATVKKYKGAQLAGALLVSAGVVACTAQEIGASTVLVLGGLFLYLGARIAAWWAHG